MKTCCWNGHLFASNVGVLPTVDGRTRKRVVISVPVRSLGHRCDLEEKRDYLRCRLLTCCRCPSMGYTVGGAPQIRVYTER